MRKSDIVIYEKDSVDVTFELEGTNELITNFEADDKIVFALRMFNSGPAILLKEQTGVTGRQVTFSLDKHDTFRLRTQRYVYDIAVLRGDDHQTTVCKSAYFTVTDKQVPIKDSAIITLDTLAQYNLLKSEMQSFYTTTRKHSRDAEDFANAALEAKTSVEQTVSSAQAEINQKVQTVQRAEQNVQSLTNNATERIGEALSTLERETTESVNAVKQAEGNAKASAEQAIEASRRARESEINAKDSEDVATLAKISAKESSDAAHRYANDVHDIYDEVQKSTEDLIEAANKAEPLLKEMQDVAEELTEAAKETTANIEKANQAVADSQSYANQAQASATSASTSASTATTQADRATTQATNATTQANNAKASADSAKTQATNAGTSATLAQGYANNASTSATNASTSATNASNSAKSAQDFATNAGANASAAAAQVAIAQTAAENALGYKNDAYDYKESAKTYAEQANAVKAELADVAYSGSYNDLSGKPTIPTVPTNVSSFNNDSGYLTEHQDISGKADKSTTYTKTEVDSITDGKVSKNGDTVTGVFNFTQSGAYGNPLRIKSLDFDSRDNSQRGITQALTFIDKNDNIISNLRCGVGNTGNHYMTILMNNHANTTAKEVGVLRPVGTDIIQTYASSPNNNPTDTEIVNVGYANNNYLKLSGGTVTGNVTIKHNSMDIVNPSAYNETDLYFADKNNKRIGYISASVNTNKVVGMGLNIADTNGNWLQGLSVQRDNNNNVWTSCYTPATTDSSTRIATTAYVKSQLTYQDFSANNMSYTAGTIGSRGYQTTFDLTVAGYTPVAISIVNINTSANGIIQAFSSTNTLYVNVYRSVATAVSGLNATIRVFYRANYS